MAKYVGFGIEEYIAKLGHLGTDTPGICKEAIYEGAKIVADAISASASRIPIESSRWRGEYNGVDQGKARGVTPEQYAGLQSQTRGGGMGIAKMKKDGGEINTSVGYHGYNTTKTERYPHGQPNAMIARAVEGGTSFRAKRPFVGPAIRKSRSAAESKMKEVIEKRINETMK